MPEVVKPNFIIIGAARSGTTSLFKYLECHPDIFMSKIKEINFFSNEKYWANGLHWYEKHFANSDLPCVGEASTSYTSAPSLGNAPKRIKETLGNIKLIYILRDPIDRFVSHYLHRVDRGLEMRSISDIICNHPNDSLLWQGRYFYQIEQYLEFFQASAIHLLSIDELKNDTQETMNSIFRFLNVDPITSKANLDSQHNANTKVTKKNAFGRYILNMYHSHVEQISYPYQFKKAFLKLSEFGATEIDKEVLTPDLLHKLTIYYSDDVRKLMQEYPLNVDSWRDYEIN